MADPSIFDDALRRAVGTRRYTEGEVRRLLALLTEADEDLLRRVRAATRGLSGTADLPRLRRLLTEVRDKRFELINQDLGQQLRADLLGLSTVEADAEVAAMERIVPIHTWASPPEATLLAVVASRPFHGRILKEWTTSLGASDLDRLRSAVRLGVVEGEGIADIARRVGGELAITRRQTEAVVRTAINHVSNAAREAVWQANSDIVKELRWTSTLDGRTTPVCQARDGMKFKLGVGPRPPAHGNCRSVMVPIVDGFDLDQGVRPFVKSTKIGRGRLKDGVGTVPASTDYGEWLARQDAGFQDEVLGPNRGKLFRSGGLSLGSFVDTSGTQYTLDELRDSHAAAFRKAGLE